MCGADEALRMAKEDFDAYGSSDRAKMIIIETDGKPTSNHEPCEIDNGDITYSDTLQALNDDGVILLWSPLE